MNPIHRIRLWNEYISMHKMQSGDRVSVQSGETQREEPTMPMANIYIAVRKYTWQNKPEIVIDDRDMTELHAGEHSSVTLYKVIEVREIDLPELPDPATLTEAEIDGLERMRANVRAEAKKKVDAINERISKLVCLEHMVE